MHISFDLGVIVNIGLWCRDCKAGSIMFICFSGFARIMVGRRKVFCVMHNYAFVIYG